MSADIIPLKRPPSDRAEGAVAKEPKPFTVVLGNFPDFPFVWVEKRIAVAGFENIDLKALAIEAYQELARERGEALGSEQPSVPATYEIVGVYEGHLYDYSWEVMAANEKRDLRSESDG